MIFPVNEAMSDVGTKRKSISLRVLHGRNLLRSALDIHECSLLVIYLLYRRRLSISFIKESHTDLLTILREQSL